MDSPEELKEDKINVTDCKKINKDFRKGTWNSSQKDLLDDNGGGEAGGTIISSGAQTHLTATRWSLNICDAPIVYFLLCEFKSALSHKGLCHSEDL